MTYPINATSFKLRFREFRAQEDARIEFAIEEASRTMDSSCWITGDYLLAYNYLVAHILMVGIMREESGTGQPVTSERIGPDFSVTYGLPEQSKLNDRTDFNLTMYGVRFMQIARANFPLVATV